MIAKPLILVDNRNRPRGTATWDQAHAIPGDLHRAFSAYVFEKNGEEILIQRRSAGKLFAGLWANTCCSHPREGEEILDVAPRRLREELGFTCELEPRGGFTYQAEDPAQRGAEHEHVTILVGELKEPVSVTANPEEVAEWKWVRVSDLREEMRKHPERYAPWFHIGLRHILDS